MDLDVRTILVLFSVLSVMLAGLIMFAGLNTKLVLSVRHWSLACLCIGAGLGLCFFFKTITDASKLAMILGCTLLGASMCCNLTAFVRSGLNSFISGLLCCLSLWFVYRLFGLNLCSRVLQTALSLIRYYLAWAMWLAVLFYSSM
jgi:hypothetical protein